MARPSRHAVPVRRPLGELTFEMVAEVEESETRRWQLHPTSVAVGVVFLAVAVAAFVGTADLPPPGQRNDPGAAGYPRLVGGAIGLLAIALMFQRPVGTEPLPRGVDLGRVLGILGLLIVYVNLLAALGYLAATALFLVASMLLAGVRRIWLMLVIAGAFSFSIAYVFAELLRVSLPRGLLERLLS